MSTLKRPLLTSRLFDTRLLMASRIDFTQVLCLKPCASSRFVQGLIRSSTFYRISKYPIRSVSSFDERTREFIITCLRFRRRVNYSSRSSNSIYLRVSFASLLGWRQPPQSLSSLSSVCILRMVSFPRWGYTQPSSNGANSTKYRVFL